MIIYCQQKGGGLLLPWSNFKPSIYDYHMPSNVGIKLLWNISFPFNKFDAWQVNRATMVPFSDRINVNPIIDK